MSRITFPAAASFCDVNIHFEKVGENVEHRDISENIPISAGSTEADTTSTVNLIASLYPQAGFFMVQYCTVMLLNSYHYMLLYYNIFLYQLFLYLYLCCRKKLLLS